MRIRGCALCILVVSAVLLCASAALNGETGDPKAEEKAMEKLTSGSDTFKIADPEENPDNEEPSPKNAHEAEALLEEMTLEEKAAQLFIVTPEALTQEGAVTAADDGFETAYAACPVGGFIMMQGNIISPEQITEFNEDLEKISLERTGVIPFLSVDEEGGTVARIASNENFPERNVGDMCVIGAEGDEKKAREAYEYIGSYLKKYGFNLDFAPDADVWNNEANTVVRYRAFASDPEVCARMTAEAVKGLESQGIWSVVKHFPGHGATSGDSHEGFALSERTAEELRECEYLPFLSGTEAGCRFVMAGHISVPDLTGKETPSSLSYEVVTEVLKDELGYDGLVVTDAMNMGAISENYTSSEAAVMAVEAGVDIILMPSDLEAAYNGLVNAVREGRISEERLNESVLKILELKLQADRGQTAQ